MSGIKVALSVDDVDFTDIIGYYDGRRKKKDFLRIGKAITVNNRLAIVLSMDNLGATVQYEAKEGKYEVLRILWDKMDLQFGY